MQVAAAETTVDPAAADASSLFRSHAVSLVGSAMAVMASVSITLAYMTILDSYVHNNYFWTHYIEIGAQSCLADAFNAQLGQRCRVVPLVSVDVALAKDYSTHPQQLQRRGTVKLPA
ncbi:hypothetical protein H310_14957 [Aphanomyces invadans]|uniref:Uncharacterized protein n=1 Tax=Aphanomyces invadans TaxID=157072 RepID=A0A024T896_9STRA|nr:hypothetical protein H310_14957 [Aphanomyces invadans]ETV90213.1 hypothetical protein H310_14957 [Aphanomyces invadans]|eukprot:XP_008881159.1 hypothetical protein H310_14957 [Aphanomyces invadans]